MSESRSPQKKLFLNASLLFSGKAAAGGFAALQTVVLARILGVTDYGLLQLVIAYIAMMNQFFDVRVWETAVRYIGSYWENGETEKTLAMIKLSYILDVGSGAVSFLIAIVTAKLVSTYVIHSPEAYIYIWIYAFGLFVETAKLTSDAILRVFEKYKNIAVINSFENLTQLVLVTALLLLGLGIKGALYGLVLSNFIAAAVRLWAVMRVLGEKNLGSWLTADIFLIRGQWKEIAWFLGNTSFMATLKTGSDKYLGLMILGFFAGKDAVAFYRIANSVAAVLNRIVDTLYEAIFPELVKLTTVNAMEEFKSFIKDSTKNLMKLIVPVTVLIIVFAGPIVRLVFGGEYAPATNTLRILALAVLVARYTYWINPALLAMGMPGIRTAFYVLTTVVYLALMLLLVPSYSYVGAALAFLGFAVIKSALSFAVFGYYMRREGERRL
ncbi:MAG: oligosaccharide flippase family protein [Thermodesulfobacteriota bacterium]